VENKKRIQDGRGRAHFRFARVGAEIGEAILDSGDGDGGGEAGGGVGSEQGEKNATMTWTHTCDVIFANTGQWLASHVFAYPRTPAQYRHDIIAAFQSLELWRRDETRRRQRSKLHPRPRPRVIWLSTQTVQLHGLLLKCPPGDWVYTHIYILYTHTNPYCTHSHAQRHDGLLAQYNAIAGAEAERFALPFLDVFGQMQPVQDLSFDGNHYSRPVTEVLVRLVMRLLFPSCFRW